MSECTLHQHERPAELNADTLLSARNITVGRQGKVILRDVSLAVQAGDFITIIGPNGAGKSMLLNVMMGFFKPDGGDVARAPGLKIGYVPQRLHPDHTIPMTVRRFITLKCPHDPATLQAVVLDTGIEAILERPLHVVSGGELQRALLARALLHRPNLLVLDEPAQNLDISGQMAFYKTLDRLYRQRGITILMVSHDLHLVMSSTKKVVCLYHHICCSGEPQVVTRDPEFISLFGDDMARMMAVYQHEHHHEHKD